MAIAAQLVGLGGAGVVGAGVLGAPVGVGVVVGAAVLGATVEGGEGADPPHAVGAATIRILLRYVLYSTK